MLSERPLYGREFIRGMNGSLFFGYPRFSGGEGCGAVFLGTFCTATKSTSPAGASPGAHNIMRIRNPDAEKLTYKNT